MNSVLREQNTIIVKCNKFCDYYLKVSENACTFYIEELFYIEL
jgi:hypothetical protein